jgi:hypothetical protein
LDFFVKSCQQFQQEEEPVLEKSRRQVHGLAQNTKRLRQRKMSEEQYRLEEEPVLEKSRLPNLKLAKKENQVLDLVEDMLVADIIIFS